MSLKAGFLISDMKSPELSLANLETTLTTSPTINGSLILTKAAASAL